MICIATAIVLPVQCTSATNITDATRNVGYSGGSLCDTSGALVSTGWYRFSGAGWTIPVSSAVAVNVGCEGVSVWVEFCIIFINLHTHLATAPKLSHPSTPPTAHPYPHIHN